MPRQIWTPIFYRVFRQVWRLERLLHQGEGGKFGDSLTIWTNTIFNLDKYILQFGQILKGELLVCCIRKRRRWQNLEALLWFQQINKYTLQLEQIHFANETNEWIVGQMYFVIWTNIKGNFWSVPSEKRRCQSLEILLWFEQVNLAIETNALINES